MNIVFLDALTLGDMPELENFNELGSFTQYSETDKDQVVERCVSADIIITNKVIIDSKAKIDLYCSNGHK
jgi:hypothetical protein